MKQRRTLAMLPGLVDLAITWTVTSHWSSHNEASSRDLSEAAMVISAALTIEDSWLPSNRLLASAGRSKIKGKISSYSLWYLLLWVFGGGRASCCCCCWREDILLLLLLEEGGSCRASWPSANGHQPISSHQFPTSVPQLCQRLGERKYKVAQKEKAHMNTPPCPLSGLGHRWGWEKVNPPHSGCDFYKVCLVSCSFSSC